MTDHNDTKRVYNRMMDAMVVVATEISNLEDELERKKKYLTTLREATEIVYEKYESGIKIVTTSGSAPITTVNHHGKQKEALDAALVGIRNAMNEFKAGYPNDAEDTLRNTIEYIERLL